MNELPDRGGYGQPYTRPTLNPEYILPTPDIVAAGISAFKEALGGLFIPARIIFLERPDIWKCYVGTTPEVGGVSNTAFYRVPEYIMQEIKDVVNNNEGFFLQKLGDDGEETYSLMNLRAAAKVVGAFPQYFPEEAVRGPQAWLRSNMDAVLGVGDYTFGNMTQTGLLSGYPAASVEAFYSVPLAAKKIVDSLGKVYRKDMSLLMCFARLGDYIDPRDGARLRGLVDTATATGAITAYDRHTLLDQIECSSRAIGGPPFVAFGTREEKDYVRKAEEIYDSGGIEKIVAWRIPS